MKKISALETIGVPGGICTTCNYMKTCIYILKIDRPIHFCEEFDDIMKCNSQPKTESSQCKTSSSKAESQNASNKTYLGLCSNCKFNRFCSFPKPEGGVWHCEEFE